MAGFGAALGTGLAGAGAGFAVGGPVGGAIGGIGSLLGGFFGGPQLPPELKRLYSFQTSIADQIRRQAQSVPLSDPQEQAALASERGLAGQQFNQQRGNLLSQLNLNNAAPGQIGDFLTNQSNAQTGQMMSLDTQHLLSALSSRRQALLQASQVAGQATSAARDYQQPADFGSIFGNLSKLLAYQKAGGGTGKPGATADANGQPGGGTLGVYQGGLSQQIQNSFPGMAINPQLAAYSQLNTPGVMAGIGTGGAPGLTR